MSLNKKVLSVAIFGALVTGNAFAANLSAPAGAIPAYFAKEIIATPAAPATLTTSASPATQLNWDFNYNFSSLEVRHARVECSDNLEFDTGTTVSVAGGGVVGALNGLGTNVLTFSLTSPTTGAINSASVFTLIGDHDITSTDQNVNCSVALYDQPSQAQNGGSTGLIQNTTSSGAYLSFAPSYRLAATPTTHIASVEATPTYSMFVTTSGPSNSTTAFLGASSLTYGLRDPDGAGAQTATFGINGLPVTLGTLLAAGTTLEVAGDFSVTANAGAPLFGAAALGRAVLNGHGNANALTASKATFNIGVTPLVGQFMMLTSRTAGTAAGMAIPESEYTVTLKAVSAAPAVYAVNDLTTALGKIVRDGTQLQAPLAQVPGGWASRLVLTNTGSIARPYKVTLMGETGNVLTAGSDVAGTVPANGTIVVDVAKLLGGFTAAPRATLNVTVAGPNNQIQGLYQIVNPDKGSISNHVLVRPGTN